MAEHRLASPQPVPERNPYLPEKPDDGQHKFKGPVDIGGNSRCEFCGAYQGSVEAQKPCEGEFRESGKMRSWAQGQWVKDKLEAGGPERKVISLVHELPMLRTDATADDGRTMRGIANESRYALLECGHKFPLSNDPDFDSWGFFYWHRGASSTVYVIGCPECHKVRNFGQVIKDG